MHSRLPSLFLIGLILIPIFLVSFPVFGSSDVYRGLSPDYKVLWLLFDGHTSWGLEWFNSSSQSWVSLGKDLTVKKAFPRNDTCKVTLVFDASRQGDYRLNFSIDSPVKGYSPNVNKFQYDLRYDGFSVVFDWSDVSATSNLYLSHGVKTVSGDGFFYFGIRKNNVSVGSHVVVDPSYVLSSSNVVQQMPQRKVHFANGLWWAFWSNSTFLYYSTSVDGVSWSDQVNLISILNDGSNFEVGYFPLYNASYFYFAFVEKRDFGGNFYLANYFCRSTINGSSLIWGTPYSVVSWKSIITYGVWNPSVGVGLDGYVYSGVDYGTRTNHRFRVYNCSANDGSGTWAQSLISGVPSYSATNLFSSSVLELASNRMLAIYSIGLYVYAYSRVWNTTAWESEVTFCSDSSGSSSGLAFGASGYNDTVLFSYPSNNGSAIVVGLFKYVYGSSWGSKESPSATVLASFYSSLTLDPVTGDSWVFFPDLSGNLTYVKRSVAGVYSGETDWIQESILGGINGNSPVSCPTTNSSGYVGVTWTVSASYYLRFDCFATATVSKTWQTISTWIFQLPSRNWTSINTWSFQALTRNWTTINAWSFQALTRQWATIETWTFQAITKQWTTIATWSFQIVARQWIQIATWIFTLDVVGWHTISTWVFALGGASNISVLFVGLAFFGFLALTIVGLRLKKRRL